MSGQVGFVLAVEILFQVIALPLDLLGDGCRVGGQLLPAQFDELTFLPEIVPSRQKLRRERGIQFEGQIFHSVHLALYLFFFLAQLFTLPFVRYSSAACARSA